MNQYTWAARRLITGDDVLYSDLPLYHVGGAVFNVVRGLWAGAEVSLWDRFSSSAFWHRVAAHRATSAVLLDVMIPWLMSARAARSDRANSLNKVHMQPLPLHHHDVARRFGFDFVTVAFGQSESGAPLFAVLEETAAGEGTPLDLYRGHTHAEMRQVAAHACFPFIPGGEVKQKGYMGQPLPYVDVAVLDQHDQPCAPGEAGELSIRPHLPSLLLDRYHAKPEATAHATRNLWFHTGDSAIRTDDGAFLFVDRLGDRIRRRGENISSFHVEDLINQHPDVRACAVVGVPSDEGDEDHIVAFIEAREAGALNLAAFSEWAESEIPRFMRPEHIRLLDELPRTPTNKVEKYKLRAEFRRVT
jgi:crotonobetaine/carnitine-CoA ligase